MFDNKYIGAADVNFREFISSKIALILSKVREFSPSVHVITSSVSQYLIANSLLALGCTPSLTINIDEIIYFVSDSDALLINLGMMDKDRRDAVSLAARIAQERSIPFVLDPVFVDKSPNRLAFSKEIIKNKPKVIKLNQKEAKLFALELNDDFALCITAQNDEIYCENRKIVLRNGHYMLAKTTATGCLLGAIIAAMLAVEKDQFLATIAAISILNIAAEIAAENANGPASFIINLIDTLSNIKGENIVNLLNIVEYNGELSNV